ncbi:MAG: alanine--glyoxylate aminotransferase family protein [Planctomycetota bacterium]|nr:MAG: alanine--glyoxylate aminotransferase family protein [Planctomycetota bacterium]
MNSALPPDRLLLGPGPSPTAPSVLLALARPTLGHLDPWLLARMDEIRAGLREVFRAPRGTALALSSTGTSGIELVVHHLVERGDRVLVGVSGYFGARLAEIARRAGADVVAVEGPWGRALDPDALRKAAGGKPCKLVALVHGETSTGVLQDPRPYRALADELGALLVLDCVTTLGTAELEFDAWGIDAAWSCSQKGLACVSGLAPVCFSERALAAIKARKQPVQSFYLDLALLLEYWGGARAYHHTASSNLLVALHEALRLVLEEGLPARWKRHADNARVLWSGAAERGLELLVPEAERLPALSTLKVPRGVDDAKVRKTLLERYDVEIGGGLGPLKGQVWRIGLMGHGSSERNARLALGALALAMAEAKG